MNNYKSPYDPDKLPFFQPIRTRSIPSTPNRPRSGSSSHSNTTSSKQMAPTPLFHGAMFAVEAPTGRRADTERYLVDQAGATICQSRRASHIIVDLSPIEAKIYAYSLTTDSEPGKQHKAIRLAWIKDSLASPTGRLDEETYWAIPRVNRHPNRHRAALQIKASTAKSETRSNRTDLSSKSPTSINVLSTDNADLAGGQRDNSTDDFYRLTPYVQMNTAPMPRPASSALGPRRMPTAISERSPQSAAMTSETLSSSPRSSHRKSHTEHYHPYRRASYDSHGKSHSRSLHDSNHRRQSPLNVANTNFAREQLWSRRGVSDSYRPRNDTHSLFRSDPDEPFRRDNEYGRRLKDQYRSRERSRSPFRTTRYSNDSGRALSKLDRSPLQPFDYFAGDTFWIVASPEVCRRLSCSIIGRGGRVVPTIPEATHLIVSQPRSRDRNKYARMIEAHQRSERVPASIVDKPRLELAEGWLSACLSWGEKVEHAPFVVTRYNLDDPTFWRRTAQGYLNHQSAAHSASSSPTVGDHPPDGLGTVNVSSGSGITASVPTSAVEATTSVATPSPSAVRLDQVDMNVVKATNTTESRPSLGPKDPSLNRLDLRIGGIPCANPDLLKSKLRQKTGTRSPSGMEMSNENEGNKMVITTTKVTVPDHLRYPTPISPTFPAPSPSTSMCSETPITDVLLPVSSQEAVDPILDEARTLASLRSASPAIQTIDRHAASPSQYPHDEVTDPETTFKLSLQVEEEEELEVRGMQFDITDSDLDELCSNPPSEDEDNDNDACWFDINEDFGERARSESVNRSASTQEQKDVEPTRSEYRVQTRRPRWNTGDNDTYKGRQDMLLEDNASSSHDIESIDKDTQNSKKQNSRARPISDNKTQKRRSLKKVYTTVKPEDQGRFDVLVGNLRRFENRKFRISMQTYLRSLGDDEEGVGEFNFYRKYRNLIRDKIPTLPGPGSKAKRLAA